MWKRVIYYRLRAFQYGIFDKIYWEKWYNLLQNKSSDTG